MAKIYWFFYISLLLFSLPIFAQNPQKKLDSLLSIHSKHLKDDSIKIKNLKEVYRQYMRMKNTAKAEEYVGKTIALAKQLNLRKFEADAYYRRGVFYHGSSNYEKSEESYLNAIKVFTLLNDLDWAGGVYLNLGALYTGIPDYVKALGANQKAIAIFQKNGNESDLASCYANISEIYEVLEQQHNSLFYLKKALKIFEKEGENSRGVAVVSNSIGSAYLTASEKELAKMGIKEHQRYSLALSCFKRSLKIGIIISDNGVQATANINLGKVYEALGDEKGALKAYQTAVAKNVANEQVREYAISIIALAKFYKKNKEYAKSISLFLDALDLDKENKLLEVQRDVFENLSEIEQVKGNYKQSLAYYKKFIAFKEQIFDEEKEKEITRKQLQINFAVKEKDYQLKQQVTDGALQRQVLFAKQQQQLLIFLSILAVILLGSAIVVYTSQRKTARLNKIVSEQKTELEKLGKVKDRIFSVVGHDMRTSVNSLISFIQLLEDGNMDPQKLNRYAGQLKNTLTYTSAMMENLLNWASSQMGGFKPILEPFDIGTCAQNVIDSVLDSAAKKDILITNTISQTKFCFADINMTTLVLRNLIHNAIKFTNEKGSINLSLKAHDKHWFIAIEDNGVGLEQDQIDAFNQTGFDENAKTTLGTYKEKGTGIGLMLCKTFTQLMNGALKVESKKNIGTTFTLILPQAI